MKFYWIIFLIIGLLIGGAFGYALSLDDSMPDVCFKDNCRTLYSSKDAGTMGGQFIDEIEEFNQTNMLMYSVSISKEKILIDANCLALKDVSQEESAE